MITIAINRFPEKAVIFLLKINIKIKHSLSVFIEQVVHKDIGELVSLRRNRLMGRKLILYAVIAQLLTCWWILMKVFLLPFLLWKLLGPSQLSARIGDLSVIALGTLATLTMGMIGYWHASKFPDNHNRQKAALISMIIIYAPLFAFIVYKFWYGSAWDTYWTLYLSGWLSIVTHPMILVGFYGKSIDILGATLLCASYLLGVWIYFDEENTNRSRRLHQR